MNYARFVDLPYAPKGDARGHDCYELVRLALWELGGIVLPDYGYPDDEAGRAAMLRDKLATDLSGWRRVERPRPLDVVLFAGDELHIGLMVARGRYLHASKRLGRSVIGRLSDAFLPPTAFYRAPA